MPQPCSSYLAIVFYGILGVVVVALERTIVRSKMTTLPYQDLLQLVHQLPQHMQLRLAENLLQTLRTSSLKKSVNVTDLPLTPVVGLTEGELKALAESVVAPDRQQRIQTLIELNRTQELSTKAEAELDELLAEIDQVVLLKARALHTLKLKQEHAA